MMLRIVSANFYAKNPQPEKDIKRLTRLNADAIGLQEAHNHLELIRREAAPLYNTHVGMDIGKRNITAFREVPILLHHKRNFEGMASHKISNLTDKGIGNARSMTTVRFRKYGRKFAHINTHLNAKIQNHDTGKPRSVRIPRVAEYIKSAGRLQRHIKQLQKRGYKVIVTGDLNYMSHKRIPGFFYMYWAPQKIFRRCGLHWVENGLDYVAWDKSLRKIGHGLVGTKATGSDHNWIVVTLDGKS